MVKFKQYTKILILLAATCNPLFGICSDHVSNVEKETAVRQKLIHSAKRWLHVRELTGNNDHPWITKAMNICGLSGDLNYPWCAACQSEIFHFANVPAPRSARVVDWFKSKVIWKRKWGKFPYPVQPGMMAGFYFSRLKRYGHIGMIVAEDKNNYYLFEGNTSPKGVFEPETLSSTDIPYKNKVIREGDGFYPKIRSKSSIAVITDNCMNQHDFNNKYNNYLKRFVK